MILVQTPPGASLAYTTDFATAVPRSCSRTPMSTARFSVMGFSLSGGSSPNSALSCPA